MEEKRLKKNRSRKKNPEEKKKNLLKKKVCYAIFVCQKLHPWDPDSFLIFYIQKNVENQNPSRKLKMIVKNKKTINLMKNQVLSAKGHPAIVNQVKHGRMARKIGSLTEETEIDQKIRSRKVMIKKIENQIESRKEIKVKKDRKKLQKNVK